MIIQIIWCSLGLNLIACMIPLLDTADELRKKWIREEIKNFKSK